MELLYQKYVKLTLLLSMGRKHIKEAFQHFYSVHPYLSLEKAVAYFSIFGGVEERISCDFFETTQEMVESHCVRDFSLVERWVSPSYLLEPPYRSLLVAVARGDGKYHSVLRKAKLSEGLGRTLVEELVALDVLYVESSRETPLRKHPKHKLPKEQRKYSR